jgi:hypothetical protein
MMNHVQIRHEGCSFFGVYTRLIEKEVELLQNSIATSSCAVRGFVMRICEVVNLV